MTGTINKHRGIPPHVNTKCLQQSQAVCARKEDVLVVKFNERKIVHAITSKYEPGYVEKTRYVKGGKWAMVMKPMCIQRYNEQMWSVDMVDQLLEPYDPTRKSNLWFRKLGLHMITQMILSARVVYQHLHPYDNSEYHDFLLTLIHEMLSEHSLGCTSLTEFEEHPEPRRKQRRKRAAPAEAAGAQAAAGPSAEEEEDEDQAQAMPHGLMKIPRREKSLRPQRKCRQCTLEGNKKWTRLYCPACPSQLGLCSVEHYQAWHNQ